MTTISAMKIEDSISPYGPRLFTCLCRYPRWIHAEGRTHRLLTLGEMESETRTPSLMEDRNLSRNASSSRAIPVERLIEDVLRDPAIPIFWGKNQKGMQADEECNSNVLIPTSHSEGGVGMTREAAWLKARDEAIKFARAFADAGYHKQIVNRLIEPFSHITVVVTATEWDNFFELRIHKDAEPHIELLARAIKKAMDESTPKVLKPGEWHLPFVMPEEREKLMVSSAIKISAARCARTSYTTHDLKVPSLQEDLTLWERLVGSRPLHASPTEHQATPDEPLVGDDNGILVWKQRRRHRNFVGWCQHRSWVEEQTAI